MLSYKDLFKIAHKYKLKNNFIIQALRAFRVLRPLRLVSGVPSLQVYQRVYKYREDNPFFAASRWIPRQLSARSSFPRYTVCVGMALLYLTWWGVGGIL